MLATLVACTTTQPAAKPEPSASAVGSVASPLAPPPSAPDASAWLSDWPKTWTDPRVVDALAADCRFVPTRPERHGDLTPPDPFHCVMGYAQSCDPGTCWLEFDCAAGCETTCNDCGGTCTKSCETCKAGCKDDACRKTCAQSCAQCKESCDGALQHCKTADCGKEHAACAKAMKAKDKANGCGPKCVQYKRCDAKCDKPDAPDECEAQCDEVFAPGLRDCAKKCPPGHATRQRDACIAQCYKAAPCSPFDCSGHTSID